jgi:O-antigen/teichoic acid export membrane protein
MLEQLRHTFKHTVIYSIGNISLKLIGLVLLPLYTKHLSISEYGVLAYLEVSSQLLVSVLALSFPTSIIRFCADESDEKKRKALIFTIFITILFTILLSESILFTFRNKLAVVLFHKQEYATYLSVLFLQVFFEIFNQLAFSLIRFKEKSKLYVIVTTLKVGIILLGNIYFIVVLKKGVMGIIISQLLGSFIMFLATIPLTIKNIYIRFNFSVLPSLLKYSYPLIFSTVSTMALTFSDRYFIEHFLNFSAVGEYSLGFKFASMINVLLIQSFQLGFLPISFKIYNQPQAKYFFAKVLTYFTLIVMVSALLLSMFSKEIIYLFSPTNKDYWTAYKIVPYLSLAFVLKGVQYVLLLGFHFVKKTHYNAIIVIIGASINIGLNFLLIPPFGLYGAAFSSIISYLIMTILYYIYAQKFYYVEYELWKLTKLFVVSVGIYLASLLVNSAHIYLNIGLKLAIFMIFPALLYLMGFYDKIELVHLKQFWDKWKDARTWQENLKNVKIFE